MIYQKKFLKLANSEITRITSLLNHLLDTSMLENPHLTHPTAVSDSNGYWAIVCYPKVSREASLKINHPEYVQSQFVNINDHMDALVSGRFVLPVEAGGKGHEAGRTTSRLNGNARDGDLRISMRSQRPDRRGPPRNE